MENKAEIILSTNGNITIKKGDKSATFTAQKLYRILEKNNYIFKQVDVNKLEIKVGHKIEIDIPRGKRRTGENYLILYERIGELGFTNKQIERNILDLQRKEIIPRKWRKGDMVHLPSFFMEASEGEIMQVLNFRLK